MKHLLFLLLALLPALRTPAQTQTPDARMNTFVGNLMKKMTLDEKIGQLNLVTPGWGMPTGSVVSDNVDVKIRGGQVGGLFGLTDPAKVRKAQELAVKNARLGIPMLFGLDVIHGHKTVFPIPLGLSCSWDMGLIEQSARIAAIEASADGLCWTFSPMVDIARDPRWGRIAEGSGEDPWLGAQIARAMVKGYQGDDLRKNNTIMACVKHFALYGAAEAGRDYNTVDMSRLTMYEHYLPPYKAAIDAGAGSVMTSFNLVDGIPATGNRWLLSDLLRTQWHFKGLVVTDYTSINEMIEHGLGDLPQVSALALRAGVDFDMVGEGFLTTLKKSLAEGKVTLTQINTACRRILEAKWKLGLFDDPYRYCDESRPAREILTAENRRAAREIAAHSFVLLKNASQTLPLKKSGTIALVGPLMESQQDMLGTWAVGGDPKQAITVLQGMKNVAGNAVTLLTAKGSNITDDAEFAKRLNFFGQKMVEMDARSPETMLREAVETAAKADVVVAVLGESQSMTGESSSRTDIGLPESQAKLLRALVETGKPVVLVLFNGRPMTLGWEDAHCAAILDVWAGGTEAGNAVADVLFGAYNPAGKLTATFPRSVGQIPLYYNHKPTGRPYSTGETKFKSNYLDAPNTPLYPFGYGLSYTSFSYGDLKLSKMKLRGNETLTATVALTNTGALAGEEVVQLYISDPVATVSRPVKELRGFQKVSLKPGESREVSFAITPQLLKYYHSNLNYDWDAGDFEIHIGTNSAEVKSGMVSWGK